MLFLLRPQWDLIFCTETSHMCSQWPPTPLAIWNKSLQWSRATSQPRSSNSCIPVKWWVSVTHTPCHQPHTGPSTAPVPSGGLACSGGQGSPETPWSCLIASPVTWGSGSSPPLASAAGAASVQEATNRTSHQSRRAAPPPDACRRPQKRFQLHSEWRIEQTSHVFI